MKKIVLLNFDGGPMVKILSKFKVLDNKEAFKMNVLLVRLPCVHRLSWSSTHIRRLCSFIVGFIYFVVKFLIYYNFAICGNFEIILKAKFSLPTVVLESICLQKINILNLFVAHQTE